MKQVLHICNNEKFIDNAIDNFSKESNHNFLIIKNNKKNHIEKKSKVTFLTRFEIVKFLYLNRSSIDAVIFHSFPDFFKLLSLLLPSKTVQVWIGWGFDYYPIIDRKNENIISSFLQVAIKSIDVFCPVVINEKHMIQEFLRKDCKIIEWNYGTQRSALKLQDDIYFKNTVKRNVIIGNSATSSNNHGDMINKVSGIKGDIYIPLNYGSEKYKKKLIEHINEEYPEFKYIALEEFIPKLEYFKIISESKYMFMNHTRQQAAGNISVALMFGVTVYMNSQSPLYDYYIDNGFYIKDINLISNYNDIQPLSDFEVKSNIKTSMIIFSEDEVNKKTRNLINCIFDVLNERYNK